MANYSTKFQVTGVLAFPIDMLRYDSSFPASSEDASKIHASLEEPRTGRQTITLMHIGAKTWCPTFRRWESFGWVVEREPGLQRVKFL